MPLEAEPRSWRLAIVERHRKDGLREIVRETEGQNHGIRVESKSLVRQNDQLLVRPVPLDRQVSSLDPVFSRIEQVCECLVVGDLQAEGDGIPQDDDAGTIPSLRQGQLASSIPG